MNLKVMANYNKTSLNTILVIYKDMCVCVCVCVCNDTNYANTYIEYCSQYEKPSNQIR